jgi:hypothetical protein
VRWLRPGRAGCWAPRPSPAPRASGGSAVSGGLRGPGLAASPTTVPLAPGEGLTVAVRLDKGAVAAPGGEVARLVRDNPGPLGAGPGCWRPWRPTCGPGGAWAATPGAGLCVPRFRPPGGSRPRGGALRAAHGFRRPRVRRRPGGPGRARGRGPGPDGGRRLDRGPRRGRTAGPGTRGAGSAGGAVRPGRCRDPAPGGRVTVRAARAALRRALAARYGARCVPRHTGPGCCRGWRAACWRREPRWGPCPGRIPWRSSPWARRCFLAFRAAHARPDARGARADGRVGGLPALSGRGRGGAPEPAHPPERTPELFEACLPYALALDCEQQWARRFSAVLEAAGRDPGAASRGSGRGLGGLGPGARGGGLGASLAGPSPLRPRRRARAGAQAARAARRGRRRRAAAGLVAPCIGHVRSWSLRPAALGRAAPQRQTARLAGCRIAARRARRARRLPFAARKAIA